MLTIKTHHEVKYYSRLPRETAEPQFLEMLERRQPEQPGQMLKFSMLWVRGGTRSLLLWLFQESLPLWMVLWFCYSIFNRGMCPPDTSQYFGGLQLHSCPWVFLCVYMKTCNHMFFCCQKCLSQLIKCNICSLEECIPYFSVTQCNECIGNNNTWTIRLVIYLFIIYVGNQ